MTVTTAKRRGQRGMTLLEVLVSLAIIGMMTLSAWRSFRATTKAMETVEEVQDRYATVRMALNRMASEIGMAYLSFNRPQAEARHFTLFEGRVESNGASLTFSAFAHLRMRMHANESDQSVIQYFLDEDPETGVQHLYRRESRRLSGDLPEDLEKYEPAYVLLENVESLEFEYWDNNTLEWKDEWRTMNQDDHPNQIPERVKIIIGIDDGEGYIEQYATQTVLFMQEKIDLSK